ncbi:hypothetical protein [Paenibacillus terrae]|uniref:DUF3889 domain-containing protein n=1 Tax=Paenibacillus terrae TaxID=159743 RepID=A0A0D7X627_9BACL|nr:hypothetical protein [Paenibacillus terrae]KJD46840.1 hypothetical protein QD47_04880 [Paenibacillus terrae]
MRIKRTLSLAALSLALTASFSTAAVFADAPTNAPKSHDVSPNLESRPFDEVFYYPVGWGIQKVITNHKTEDGYVGTIIMVSYEIKDGIVAVRYQGTVYK